MTTRHFTRREALKLGALGAGVVLLPPAFRSARARAAVAHASPCKPPFQVDLPIQPILQPMSRDATTDFYQITQRASTHEFIPGISTPVWGDNGIVPGPTILARKGRRVEKTHVNQLPPGGDLGNILVPFPNEPDQYNYRDSSTVVHHHGANLDSLSDGYPEFTLPAQRQRRGVHRGAPGARVGARCGFIARARAVRAVEAPGAALGACGARRVCISVAEGLARAVASVHRRGGNAR